MFHHQGPVPRKMVKFNPGLSEILSPVFLLRARNSSLQNTAAPLLRGKVMIDAKCFPKQCIGRVIQKLEQNLNPRALNPGLFFLCSKAFSRIIFSVIFRVSDHQLLDENN